jgi:hypothetical protein
VYHSNDTVQVLVSDYPAPRKFALSSRLSDVGCWLARRAKLMPAVGQTPPTPPPTPPSCSECATKMQPAGGGAATQSASRLTRSSDGKMRIDLPKNSVISDPVSGHTIMLDHEKKEAMIVPMVPGSAGAAPSGTPATAPGGAPQPPPVHVEDLGKSMIEGHEVEGKRYTLPAMPAPPKPAIPGMPKPPALPKVQAPGASAPGAPPAPGGPAAPAGPKPPAAPKMPPVPSVTELWTSVKLKTPVLTKVTTSAGEQTTYCKPTSTAEPHPSLFQIPPGYKIKSK